MNNITDLSLSRLSVLITEKLGLYFPEDRLTDLERGIKNASKDFGFKDNISFIKWLLSAKLNQEQVKNLAVHLTIGETYFFRDKIILDVLKNEIIPLIIKQKKEKSKVLKIWCAGCSTGEEPYSIAIELKNIESDSEDYQISILGTDLNQQSLDKARKGIYREWSLRNTPSWVKKSYFSKLKTNKYYQINQTIMEMVKFSYLNLVEDSYPSKLIETIDIIFCRNVLMYFSKEQCRKVVDRFYQTLGENGWLIVSSVETSVDLFSNFTPVSFPGLLVYHKGNFQNKSGNISEEFNYSFSEISNYDENFKKSAEILNFQPELNSKNNILKEIRLYQNEYSRALDLYKLNQYLEAEQILLDLFQKIKFENTEMKLNFNIISLLIKLYANSRKLDEASQWCDIGISINKLEPIFYFLLATILQEKGKFQEAIQSLKTVLYLEENFILAHFILGNLNLQQGKIKESNNHFQKAISLLEKLDKNELIPESEELNAGQLIEIIKLIIGN